MADDDQLQTDGQSESSQPPEENAVDPWIGQTLCNYVVIRRLGQGGMGVVYLARYEAMDRFAAVKFLPDEMASNPAYVERFLREAKLAAKLHHSNIISVYDAGYVGENIYFFIMEYVEGRDLGSLLCELKVLTIPAAVACIRQAAAALGYAHQKNIIHRDIKPENLMLTHAGIVKVGDLGLAKLVQVESDAGLTQPMTVLGTAAYISPEQVRASKDVDSRTDIYSLGATFYRLVTGKLPYEGQTPAVMLSKHLNSPVPEPHRANPNLDTDICAIIKKMMAKRLEDRFQTMEEVVGALNEYRSQKTHPPQPLSELASHVQETQQASTLQQTEPGAPATVAPQPFFSVRTGLTIAVSLMVGIVIGFFAISFFKRGEPSGNDASAHPHESVVTPISIAEKAISEPTKGDSRPPEVVSPREPSSQPPPLTDQKDSLIIADFNSKGHRLNNLGGVSKGLKGNCGQRIVPAAGPDGSGAWMIIYKIPGGSSAWAGTSLQGLDPTDYDRLSFRVRSQTFGNSSDARIDFYVGLSVAEEVWYEADTYLVKDVGRDWKTVVIPLSEFKLPALRPLEELTFGFDPVVTPLREGWIFIDDIMLLK